MVFLASLTSNAVPPAVCWEPVAGRPRAGVAMVECSLCLRGAWNHFQQELRLHLSVSPGPASGRSLQEVLPLRFDLVLWFSHDQKVVVTVGQLDHCLIE